MLDENTRFCGSLLIWKATILDENTRCWTKIHDFAARFLFENRRFWTKMRDFAAVTGYAPRAARGAQWRVLSGSKTRHLIHGNVQKYFHVWPCLQKCTRCGLSRYGNADVFSMIGRATCSNSSGDTCDSRRPNLAFATLWKLWMALCVHSAWKTPCSTNDKVNYKLTVFDINPPTRSLCGQEHPTRFKTKYNTYFILSIVHSQTWYESYGKFIRILKNRN